MMDIMGALAKIRTDKGLDMARSYQTSWENALSDMSILVENEAQRSAITGLLQEVLAAKHYRLRG